MMMTCDDCGGELVEVDNPMRREVRHKRGVVCTPLTAEQRQRRDELLSKIQLIRIPGEDLRAEFTRSTDTP